MTMWEYLVSKSTLPSGTALEHFLNAIKQPITLSKCIISTKSIRILISGFSSTVDTIVKNVTPVLEPNTIRKHVKPEIICKISNGTNTVLVIRPITINTVTRNIDYDLTSNSQVVNVRKFRSTIIRL